jgi:hypothetical protein
MAKRAARSRSVSIGGFGLAVDKIVGRWARAGEFGGGQGVKGCPQHFLAQDFEMVRF